MRVHPAHERQSIAELPLELQRIHPRTVALDRVEHIQADLDQVADDRAQRAAAVIGHGQAPLLADGEDARQLRLDLLAPGPRAHHHALLRRHVIARPQPVQRHPIARRFGQLNREISAAPEHLAGQARIGGHIRQRIRHAAQPPVHLEDARRDVAADEIVGRIRQHRGHQVEQRRLAFDREMIAQHLIPRRAGQGEMLDLVEAVPVDPLDAPIVHVPLAFLLVDDPLHRVVVVDPGLAHIVAHRLGHVGGGDFEQPGQVAGRLRVKPHEHGNPIDRLAAQGRVDALLCIHGAAPLLRGNDHDLSGSVMQGRDGASKRRRRSQSVATEVAV